MTSTTNTRTDTSIAAENRFAAGNTNELVAFDLPTGRRWPYLLLGVVLGVAATVAVTFVNDRGDDDDAQTDVVQAELATAQVGVQNLVEEVDWVADLRYGDGLTVLAAVDGTVTGTVETGVGVSRGDVVVELDNEPVPLLYGELPFWRALSEGTEGPDVRQLETNLVTLGYDPDITVTIDETFTANTAAMVERWQEDIGRDITGSFDVDAAVVAAGPIAVSTPATVGARLRSGDVITELSTRSVTDTIVGQATGTVVAVAPIGTAVAHGTVLYETDDLVVQAIVPTDDVGDLLADPEAEPTSVETALVAGGFDPTSEIIVDSIFDDATIAAVERWQAAMDLTVTGALSSEGYRVVTRELDVAEQLVAVGDILVAPTPVLELAASTMQIVVPVGLADQDDFVVGEQVEVELPDETIVPGRVTEVGTEATASEPDGDLVIDVIVELTELVADDLPAAEVTVTVAGESVVDAMVVPTRALVTLAEGGFAVEKMLADGTTVLVAVETGAFDDGVVEVTSSQLEPGDDVVVPQ